MEPNARDVYLIAHVPKESLPKNPQSSGEQSLGTGDGRVSVIPGGPKIEVPDIGAAGPIGLGGHAHGLNIAWSRDGNRI